MENNNAQRIGCPNALRLLQGYRSNSASDLRVHIYQAIDSWIRNSKRTQSIGHASHHSHCWSQHARLITLVVGRQFNEIIEGDIDDDSTNQRHVSIL
jgi:hypothetical protein